MKRQLKAIAAAAAIIAPVAVMATPASAQPDPNPDIVSLRIIGSQWEEYVPEGAYTVYENELPEEWSISLDSPDADSVRWTVNGLVENQEEEHPYLITNNSADSWEPSDWGPGTYDIMATAFTGPNQTGSSNAFETRLVIEPGTRPSYDFVANAGFDAHDSNPGDGLCAAVVDGEHHCTLRAAVEELNATGGGRIGLKTFIWSYQLELGDLDITTPMGIIGLDNGKPIVDGNDIGRVFDINAPGDLVLLSNLEIRNGNVLDDPVGERTGGNIRVRDTSLWLNISLVKDGAAIRGGGIDFEAGDNPHAAVYVSHSRIENNHATRGSGGGIYSADRLSIEHTEMIENTAIKGGALALTGDGETLLFVNNTMVAHNEAIKGGSGLNIEDAVATINYTTIADNVTRNNDTPWSGPNESGGIWMDNPWNLTLQANALVGNTFSASGQTTLQPADCASPHGTSFKFKPANYVDQPNSVCRVDAFHGFPVATATGVPAYVPSDYPWAYTEYVVSERSPLWGLGIGSDATCPTFDVYGTRRADDGGCTAGAVARAEFRTVDNVEGIEIDVSQAPVVIPTETLPELDTTDLELPDGIGSTLPLDEPQLTLPGTVSIGGFTLD